MRSAPWWVILLQWGNFGGDVYATHINEQTIINHTNYASSESYLYTGFFASQYQEQYPGLTATPARMILTNIADGGAPLDFEVCGYTAEQQIAMVSDYNDCYNSNLGNGGNEVYYDYRREIIDTLINEGFGEVVEGVPYPQLQQSVEQANNNLLQGEG